MRFCRRTSAQVLFDGTAKANCHRSYGAMRMLILIVTLKASVTNSNSTRQKAINAYPTATRGGNASPALTNARKPRRPWQWIKGTLTEKEGEGFTVEKLRGLTVRVGRTERGA